MTTSAVTSRRSMLMLAAAWWAAFVAAGAATADEQPEPAPDGPATVIVGAYLNDVQALDLREHSYAVDIYIWFRWRDAKLAPHETVEMVNPNELWGHTSETLYEEPIVLPTGEFYQVLRVQGRFSRKFYFDDFPYDRQQLVVEFEDAVHETNRMLYQADSEPVAVNPRLKLPGFRLEQPQLAIERFAYPTSFGDTRRSEPNEYSRVQVSLPIVRPAFTTSLKLLLPVLCVVLGASLMLLLKTTYVDARVSIGITSLLTVVAIQLAANETMPSVDYLILMDKIHLAAYVYVLVGLAIVLRTAQQVDQNAIASAQTFQRRGFLATTGVFLLVVAIMIGLAIVRR